MPKIRLTQVAVDKLRPPAEGRVEYWDTHLPGFGLRVSKDGRKTWQCLYRVNGKAIRETLGTTALIPKVDAARDRARTSMLKARTGVSPVEERRRVEEQEQQSAQREAARQRNTLATVLDRYLKEYGAKRWRPHTLKEVTRSFEYDVKPVLGATPVREITRRDVRELLDAIVERGRAPLAGHVLSYVRPALAWAVEKEIIDANPAEGIPDPDPRRKEARTRDRYLDDDEIRLFWPACDKIGWPFGPLFQLLLLTAQRRDELAEAPWSEFDLDKALWTIPRERAKNHKAHLIHLSPLAIEILGALPRVGDTGLIFTMGTRPVSGFTRARNRVSAAMAEQADEAKIEHFVIHDLRRSAATGMARIGIAHHVLDRVLNHTSGKISGVAAIYNRHQYLDERKAALEAWSKYVDSLVRGGPANVLPFAARR